MNAITRNLLAAARATTAIVALPLIVGASLVQAAIGPMTHNYALSRLTYKGITRLFGYKIKFNENSAPLVKDKRTLFLLNHMSAMDVPLVFGATFNAALIGKEQFLKWPVIGQLMRGTNFVGISRKKEKSAETLGKIIRKVNSGSNALMCPEATTHDGSQVYLYHAGILSLFYNGNAVDKRQRAVKLEEDVVVQSVAVRVKSVNGKDAANDARLRSLYTMHDEHNALRQIWKRLQVRSMTLELTAFDPLDPRKFANAPHPERELANTAAVQAATVINPGQTHFPDAFTEKLKSGALKI